MVRVADLKVYLFEHDGEQGWKDFPIQDSPFYRSLRDKTPHEYNRYVTKLDSMLDETFTTYQKFLDMSEKIRTCQWDWDKERIELIDTRIHDGQHRLCCGLYHFGNDAKVKIRGRKIIWAGPR